MGKDKQQLSGSNTEQSSIFLDELAVGFNGPITVMICRKWDVNNINGRYMSTDFIISDKKGNFMHCITRNNISHCFVNKLSEGNIYSLKGFTVQPNKDEYRILKDSPYIIELQGTTVVSKATDDAALFVHHPFHLFALEDLKPTEKKYFVDVIGYVTSLGQPSKKSNGGQTLEFNLTNERGRHVRVTLWGKTGDGLLEKTPTNGDVHAIILTSMSAKYYLSQLCLSSSSSTLVIDNEEVPALKEFRNIGPIETNTPVMQVQPPVETLDALLQWACYNKNEVSVFRGEVEVTNIRTKNSWFNFTCTGGRCRKGVSRRSGNFWCEACESAVPFPRPRFRLQLDIKDESAAAVVVLFDEIAEKLTKTTAKALLAGQNEDEENDSSVLPRVLENLINSRHVFEIKSSTYYHFGDFESFNCSHVLTPVVETQPAVAVQGGTIESGTPFSASSSMALPNFATIATPAKKTETRKRRRNIVESDSEGSDTNKKGGVGGVETQEQHRAIEAPDSESESFETVKETQEEKSTA